MLLLECDNRFRAAGATEGLVLGIFKQKHILRRRDTKRTRADIRGMITDLFCEGANSGVIGNVCFPAAVLYMY